LWFAVNKFENLFMRFKLMCSEN